MTKAFSNGSLLGSVTGTIIVSTATHAPVRTEGSGRPPTVKGISGSALIFS